MSRAEAEVALKEFGTLSGMEIVLLRTPLVDGPDVKANSLVW